MSINKNIDKKESKNKWLNEKQKSSKHKNMVRYRDKNVLNLALWKKCGYYSQLNFKTALKQEGII